MIDVPLAAPTAPDALRQMFLDACARPTSINEHLTVLRDTASGCQHITELGLGDGYSTLAWLLVQPTTLVCIDLGWQECFPRLEAVRGRTELVFLVGDSRLIDIEPTDLLFIDTIHTYAHLSEELRLHALKARRFLVLHDVEAFGAVGEDGTTPGIWRAVEELVTADRSWRVIHRATHNNGLAVLKREA